MKRTVRGKKFRLRDMATSALEARQASRRLSPRSHAHREIRGVGLVESEPSIRMSVRAQAERFVQVPA